jgi:thioredoxin reductase/ferredoxin
MAVKLTIDDRSVAVEDGATILDAAHKLGIEIPTLCHLDELPPASACLVCVVRVNTRRNLIPSCAAPAEDGMVVTTNSDEVRTARKTALELLLSDHVGDCVAPCTLACPAGMDIPAMIRHLCNGRNQQALAVIRERIALPGVLGRICPRYCERVCRRGGLDEPIAICALKRFPADVVDLGAGLPLKQQPSGNQVAILGAGAAGLSAAFYLLQQGHACTIYDAHPEPGGTLRYGTLELRPARHALEKDIDVIRQLGVEFRMNTRIDDDAKFARIRGESDALLVALGAGDRENADGDKAKPPHHSAESLGLEVSPRGIAVDRNTLATAMDGVFAAGEVVSGPTATVRTVRTGRLAAVSIDQYLKGEPLAGEAKQANVIMSKLDDCEREALYEGVAPAAREQESAVPHASGRDHSDETTAGLSEAATVREVLRCLQCDCLARDSCKLRSHATAHGAVPRTFRGERRPFERDASHPEIIYEAGKCIMCGLCVRMAEKLEARPGITFIGRGFPAKAAVPFGRLVAQGLPHAARRCAAVCPTAALALKPAKTQSVD